VAFNGVMDEGLPGRLARNLDGSFPELVDGYQRLLYSVALRVTGDSGDAEDVAQEAFERAYRALAGYPQERVAAMRLRPWLAQITVNLARSRWRRRTVATRPLTDHDGEVFAAAASQEPAERTDRAHANAVWADLLGELPIRQREAVVLRVVEDLPYAEIAEALGQPVGTVKANVHRGVRRLRAAYDARVATETRR
jgi:RNA polymerase sigma factor (sigma-70 family)